MQKIIIGALVGALILFIWQFLSWGLINFHADQMAYTAKQDAVLQALAEAELEEGDYFMPQLAPGFTPEDMQQFEKEQTGKPWALVRYRKAYQNNMPMNMIRGFAVDFVALLLLCWMLGKMSGLNLTTTVMVSIAVGLIGYFSINYINSIWFEGNTLPDLLDAVVSWGLVGAWLGWWLNRG